MADLYSQADAPATDPCRKLAREGDAARDPRSFMALYLAARPRRPEDARGLVDGAAAHRQARHADGSLHLQMGDRCADRCEHGAGAARELGAVAARFAVVAHARLRRHPRTDGAADAMARRHLCPCRHACGAQARLHHLRAHARAVAALPSRAQDRRADPHPRARPHRHRGDRAHGDPAADPDRWSR